MTKPKILVTAAAGHTGMATVIDLLKQGFPVRAFVRRNDARSRVLEKAGAEIFIGNLFDLRHLRRAMKGIQRAYHCPPFANNLLHNSMLFAIAAEEEKLEVVVLLSAWNPNEAHPSVVSREHWITNQIFRWMPSVDLVYVNPGLFAFTYMLGLPAIKHLGMFVAPFGQGKNAPPSNEDIAKVIASILANPKDHIGKNYRPTGPKLISPSDAAEIYSNVLQRKVRYQSVPFSIFAKAAKAQEFPLMDISQLRFYTEELQRGAFEVAGVTNHVEMVTGKAPEPFDTTVRRYFKNPKLIHPNLKEGSKLSAWVFMLRMMLTRVPNLDAWETNHGHPTITNPTLSHNNKDWMKAAQKQQLHLLGLNN